MKNEKSIEKRIIKPQWILVAFVLLSFSMVGCDVSNNGASNKMPIPPKGFVASIGQGKSLYRSYCSGCHGADVTGSHRGPPLLHKVYEPSHHADYSFYMAASKGVKAHHWKFGNMPPVSGASPEDVGHIIAFVRSEQRKVGIR